MRRFSILIGIAVLIAVGVLFYYWLKVRSNERSEAFFLVAVEKWGLDPSLYKEIGYRSLPNQPSKRVWSRNTRERIEEIEVTELGGLVCRSVKDAFTAEWRSLGCLHLQPD